MDSIEERQVDFSPVLAVAGGILMRASIGKLSF
jgi:hypothetical protein